VIENPHNASHSMPDEASLEMPSAQAASAAETPAHEQPPAALPSDAPVSEAMASGEEEAAQVEPAAEEPEDERGPIEEIAIVDEPPKMNWYILKVQSNREESIRESLKRRVAVAGLDRYFGEIIVPTEMVSEFKGGKKRVVKRKLYPGYLVVNMEINEETWFLVRETPGIGDFTGSAGKPTPMLPHEVSKIVAKQEEKADEAPKLKINFNVADRVKINEGTFENFEGEVDSIDEASGRVTVMINIFGRSTPVELEYWQIEAI
jgi:transcription termination/antitermination protein NusG